jgi:predicted aspartyl protease
MRSGRKLVLAATIALLAAGAPAQVVPAPLPPAPLPPAPLPPATGPLIPRAAIDNTLEVQGEALRARVIESRMTVAVMVNGKGPFRFLIDTGADRSVIGAGLARQLGLVVDDEVRMHHVAGESMIGTVTLDSLRAGTNEVMGIRAPVLPEEFLGAQGIMGIDALREQLIAMDFDKRTITLQDPRRPESSRLVAGEIVVIGRRHKGQLILAAFEIGNVQLDAVIDTGAQVTMGNSALLRRLFRGRRRPPATQVDVTSVTGQVVKAELIVVPRIKVGELIIQNVPIAFVDTPPFKLFGLARTPAVLLGNDVLESFRRVTLDFRRRKVRFVLRSQRRQLTGSRIYVPGV